MEHSEKGSIRPGEDLHFVTLGDRSYLPETVVTLLDEFLSDDRKARIEAVLAERIQSIVPVIEGVHDLGNVGAVIRSAEGLGYTELHVIDRGDQLKRSRRTSQGAEKWLDLVKWSSTEECIQDLKKRGNRIIVTHLDKAEPLESFDFTIPSAIVFGNEADGVSEEILEMADRRCCIPMSGFAQSFNVSVAAAITLYHIRRDRVDRTGSAGDLDEKALNRLRARYYVRSVQAAGQILRRLTKKQS